MAVKVKFPLKMANGSQVRTLEDLRENFDLVSVLGYYDTGRLYDWLMVYYYEEEAKKINALDSSADDFKQSLCDILGVTYTEEESVGVDLSDISERNERLAKLKTFTANDAILAAVDNVAFTQEELDSLSGKDTDVIYLCGEQFNIPANKGNVRYVGVNAPKVSIPNNFTENGIIFEEVEFDLDGIIVLAKSTYNHEKAMKLWRKAAEQGNAEAEYELGKCYLNGHGVESNEDEAFNWFQKSATQGYADAQCMLGARFGLMFDYESGEQHEWTRKAAAQGHAQAQCDLGATYYYGDFAVDKNIDEAVKWLCKSAGQGNVEALCLIFKLYCDEDNKKAVEWWCEIEKQGYAKSLFEVWVASKQVGIELDRHKAAKCLYNAAEQGYAEAQYEFALEYSPFNFLNSDKKDNLTEEEYYKWIHKAAEQGLFEAQERLFRDYCHENDVDLDGEEAFKWLCEKAEQGHAEAQYQLGSRYQEGYGVEVNEEEAIKRFHKAAKQGHSTARYDLEELANK
jgi:TPR repeat protein